MKKIKLAEEAFEKVKDLNAEPKSSQNDEIQNQILNSAQYKPLSYKSRTKNCEKKIKSRVFYFRFYGMQTFTSIERNFYGIKKK